MKITIIGGGNMGTAYAASLAKNGIVAKEEIVIIEKNKERADFLVNEGYTATTDEINQSLSESDFVILSVKPQAFVSLSKEITDFLNPKQVIISIMAGITMEVMQKNLVNISQIVRAMPNTPCQLGMGITGYAVTDNINDGQLDNIKKILNSNGDTVLVKEEALLDAVTAVSGSGPAYFYYFLKHMVKAGTDLGLEEESASLLAKQTMLGSYHLFNQSGKSLDELITAVTSKGGTTEAALNAFDAQGVGIAIEKGLTAARDRAIALSKIKE